MIPCIWSEERASNINIASANQGTELDMRVLINEQMIQQTFPFIKELEKDLYSIERQNQLKAAYTSLFLDSHLLNYTGFVVVVKRESPNQFERTTQVKASFTSLIMASRNL